MERLTTRLPDGRAFPTKCVEHPDVYQQDGTDLVERLAEYEDAEEQGRLIEFPVAIGQHLWELDDYGIIEELAVHELVQSADGQTMLADSSGIRTYYSLSHIGETIFPTREQAEAKLKEMEADNAENNQTE